MFFIFFETSLRVSNENIWYLRVAYDLAHGLFSFRYILVSPADRTEIRKKNEILDRTKSASRDKLHSHCLPLRGNRRIAEGHLVGSVGKREGLCRNVAMSLRR